MTSVIIGEGMVPVVGFELTTYRLQGGCSTPELNRHGCSIINRDSLVTEYYAFGAKFFAVLHKILIL
jgi:hypothetical protein